MRSVAIIIKAIDIFLARSLASPLWSVPVPPWLSEPGGVPLRVPFPPEREGEKRREPMHGF